MSSMASLMRSQEKRLRFSSFLAYHELLTLFQTGEYFLSCSVGVIILLPTLLNKWRISNYQFPTEKTDNWYLPREIPSVATSVYYNGTSGWGQGSSSSILRFRLPEHEAKILRKSIMKKNPSNTYSDHSRPDIGITKNHEELAWVYTTSNHGADGGVWYNSENHEFIFFHEQW